MEPFLLRTILKKHHNIEVSTVFVPLENLTAKAIWEPIEELTDNELFFMEKAFKRKKYFDTKLEAIRKIISDSTGYSVSMHINKYNLQIVLVKK